ncbi:hypothetical protein COOONC_14416 [Cooperia oncophora]
MVSFFPKREIPATGLETFAAIKVVAEEMVAQFVEPEIRRRVKPTPPPLPKRRGYKIVDTTPHDNIGESTTTEGVTEAPTETTPEVTSTTTTTTETVTTDTTTSIEPPEESSTVKPSVLICIDYGSYCRLWSILTLCDRPSVMSMCAKSCQRACRP